VVLRASKALPAPATGAQIGKLAARANIDRGLNSQAAFRGVALAIAISAASAFLFWRYDIGDNGLTGAVSVTLTALAVPLALITNIRDGWSRNQVASLVALTLTIAVVIAWLIEISRILSTT
jgi:hypothetical protein